jgi:hypothetical protein
MTHAKNGLNRLILRRVGRAVEEKSAQGANMGRSPPLPPTPGLRPIIIQSYTGPCCCYNIWCKRLTRLALRERGPSGTNRPSTLLGPR